VSESFPRGGEAALTTTRTDSATEGNGPGHDDDRIVFEERHGDRVDLGCGGRATHHDSLPFQGKLVGITRGNPSVLLQARRATGREYHGSCAPGSPSISVTVSASERPSQRRVAIGAST
jgi:hypothetical protein